MKENKRIRKIKGKTKLVSDEELKKILEKEYKANPEQFVTCVREPLPDNTQDILAATAGKTIEPLKKCV